MSEQLKIGMIDAAKKDSENLEMRERVQGCVGALRGLAARNDVPKRGNTRIIKEEQDVVTDRGPERINRRVNPDDSERIEIPMQLDVGEGYYPIIVSYPENQDDTSVRITVEFSRDIPVGSSGKSDLAGAAMAGFMGVEGVRLKDFTLHEDGTAQVEEGDFTRLYDSGPLRPDGRSSAPREMTPEEVGEMVAMLEKARLGKDGNGEKLGALIPKLNELVTAEA